MKLVLIFLIFYSIPMLAQDSIRVDVICGDHGNDYKCNVGGGLLVFILGGTERLNAHFVSQFHIRLLHKKRLIYDQVVTASRIPKIVNHIAKKGDICIISEILSPDVIVPKDKVVLIIANGRQSWE